MHCETKLPFFDKYGNCLRCLNFKFLLLFLILGLTGGLAAPLVAAGAGVIIGGAGAAALGSAAGVAIIGSLFGVAGAGLTGELI